MKENIIKYGSCKITDLGHGGVVYHECEFEGLATLKVTTVSSTGEDGTPRAEVIDAEYVTVYPGYKGPLPSNPDSPEASRKFFAQFEEWERELTISAYESFLGELKQLETLKPACTIEKIIGNDEKETFALIRNGGVLFTITPEKNTVLYFAGAFVGKTIVLDEEQTSTVMAAIRRLEVVLDLEYNRKTQIVDRRNEPDHGG